MIEKLFFIFNDENGRLERVAKHSVRLLYILSFLSREQQRHPSASYRTRERSTVPIGIFNTVLPVSLIFEKTFLHVTGHHWLIVLKLSFDGDAGTPSAATAPLSPVPPTLRTSGRYKASGPDVYKKHTQSLYLSKRGRYFVPPLLPCRVKQPLA